MVRTKRMGGGDPMIVGYIAGFDTSAEASAAVMKHIGASEGEGVLAASPASEVTLKGLKVTLAQFGCYEQASQTPPRSKPAREVNY